MRFALLALLPFVAFAQTCPDGADECEFELEGTLVSSRRSARAKWDELEISTGTDAGVIGASVNIPNRRRLKLKPGTRYRFKIGAFKPFGARDVWVTDAKRL